MATYSTKLSVKDSFDEEDVSDDVDDEVFIRDGRNGYKVDEERGVKRPLMAPRRKVRNNKVHEQPNLRVKSTFKILWAPCFYGILALTTFLGFIAIAVVIINFLPLPSWDLMTFWHPNRATTERLVVPCADLTVSDEWIKTFPKLSSETAVRLNDVNNDSILDIIIGFGTDATMSIQSNYNLNVEKSYANCKLIPYRPGIRGKLKRNLRQPCIFSLLSVLNVFFHGADGKDVPDYVCDLYFGRKPPCLGGLMALDGKSGQLLWQHWTRRPLLTVDCKADITKDSVHDCIIAGKGGVLHAVNGHDGSMVWQLQNSGNGESADDPFHNVYSAQFIVDTDGDSIVDVIASHTSADSTGSLVEGTLLLISGQDGRIIRNVESPNQAESYYAPQHLVQPDGQDVILLGVGGFSSNLWGGIHALPLQQLANGKQLTSQTLLIKDARGVTSPPVLVDINRDKTQDIIISFFNSTVVAFDGITFKPIWNHSFANSQTFSSATPGYFNDDDVPDFLVKYQTGLDFPVYHYSQMNILDGRSGAPLLDHPVVDSVGSQVAGLGLSIEGVGNDWMLYWTADCNGHEGSQEPFTFAKGSSLRLLQVADLCLLRFNSTMFITLWAINQHVQPPGVALYSSEWRRPVEFNDSVNIEGEAQKYIEQHPDFLSTRQQEKVPAREEAQREQDITQTNPNSDSGPTTYRHKGVHVLEENRSRSRPNYDAYPGSTYESRILYPVDSDSSSIVGNSGRSPPIPIIGEQEKTEDTEYPPSQRQYVGRKPGSPNGRRGWRPMGSLQPQSHIPTENIYIGSSEDILRQPQESNPDANRKDLETRIEGSIREYPRYPDEVNQNLKRLDTSFDSPRHSRPYGSVLGYYRVSGQKDSKDGYEPGREIDDYIPETVSLDAAPKDESLRGKRATTVKGKAANGAKPDISSNTSSNEETNKSDESARKKRGVYQLTSTGTLAPALSGKGIDLIFISQWVPPSEQVQILTEKDEECIRQGLLKASDNLGKYAGMGQDTETVITNICTRYKTATDTQDQTTTTSNYPNNPATPQAPDKDSYDPLKLRMGQLTVYRINIQCSCRTVKQRNEVCANILPFEKQSWSSYMGKDGDGYFSPRF